MTACSLCERVVAPCADGRTRSRCHSCFQKVRRLRLKLALVKLFGGCCLKCGWSGNVAAFEFHHREGTEKKFTLGDAFHRSWAMVLEEAKKCDLLCSNCHRIEHCTRVESKVYAELDKYAGTLYGFEAIGFGELAETV